MESLKNEKVSEIGDLYLDVAEALMETSEFEYAKDLLLKLLDTPNYDLVSFSKIFNNTFENQISVITVYSWKSTRVLLHIPVYDL